MAVSVMNRLHILPSPPSHIIGKLHNKKSKFRWALLAGDICGGRGGAAAASAGWYRVVRPAGAAGPHRGVLGGRPGRSARVQRGGGPGGGRAPPPR
jgi:hypothetical protein